MADSGKNASFKFGATVYDADDCISGFSLSRAINDVVYQCNGVDKHAAGTKSYSFSVSLALAASDTTKISALAEGATGAFEAHPGGDTATYIEAEATRGLVTQSNIGAEQNGVITMDVTIALDDLTMGAAT